MKEEHIILKWTINDHKLNLCSDIECNAKHWAAVLVQVFKNNPMLMKEFVDADPAGLSALEKKSL